MEREHVKGNLQRIIAIAETMRLPGSPERIMELARHTLHMIDRDDAEIIQQGLICATLVECTRVLGKTVDFEDVKLLQSACLAAHELEAKRRADT